MPWSRTPRTTRPLKARGVYEAPFLSTADETVLVAINHRGQRIAERIIAHDADTDAAWAGLRAFLDREDPPARATFQVIRAS